MGLSKKLGQASTQRIPHSGLLDVAYKWSTQSYTVDDIIDKFKLPCIVQCATDDCSIQWSKFEFNLCQPLLLYSRQTTRKLHAKNLSLDDHQEIGPSVAIPETYEGWFGASAKGISQTKRHTRIESVANSNALRFVVCTKCPALSPSIDASGNPEYLLKDVNPGETFKRVCLLDGELEDPDTPEVVRLHGPCLECLDEKEDSVILPLSRRVIAYEISDLYPDTNHKVFNVKSIVSGGNSKLPRIVSVVHGERPALDFAYTGMLRCYSVFSEETILAASLDCDHCVCLELARDSKARFRLSLNERTIKMTTDYSNALYLCKTSGESFMNGMKVSFTVSTNLKPDDLDTSFNEIESTSDIHDVDANSEFEIEWSSEHNTDSSASHSQERTARSKIKDVLSSCQMTQQSKNYENCEPEGLKEKQVTNDLPSPPVDFTEQEIANLMVRKGMMPRLGALSSSDLNLAEEIETLRREKGKGKGKGKTPQYENMVLELEDKNPQNDAISLNASDIVEVSLDETEYVSAVCKAANEYNEKEFDNVEEEMEITESNENGDLKFTSAVFKRASEYYETEDSDGDDEDKADSRDVSQKDTTYCELAYTSAICKRASEYHENENVGDDENSEERSKSVDEDSIEHNLNSCGESDNVENGARVKESCGIISGTIADSSVTTPGVDDNPLPSRRRIPLLNSHNTDIPHGLKASSSNLLNVKKTWNQEGEKGDSPLIQKIRSESNISKLIERFKGSEDDRKTVSSSRIRGLKNSHLSSPEKDREETEISFTFVVEDDQTPLEV